MSVMQRFKAVLQNTDNLATARTNAQTRSLLAPLSDAEVHHLSQLYRQGVVSREVNAWWGTADEPGHRNARDILEKIPRDQLEQLKSDYDTQCPPGGCPIGMVQQ